MVSVGCNLSPSGSVSLVKKSVYGKESILVSFKVSYIYIYIYISKVDLVLDRKMCACLTYVNIFFIKHKIIKQDFKYFAILPQQIGKTLT